MDKTKIQIFCKFIHCVERSGISLPSSGELTTLKAHRGNLWEHQWKKVRMLGFDGLDVEQWNAYVNILKLNYICLKEESDSLVCSWSPSKHFTASLGYKSHVSN